MKTKPTRIEVAKLQEILDIYADFEEPQRSASIAWALEAVVANPSRKLRKRIDDAILADADDLLKLGRPDMTAEERALLLQRNLYAGLGADTDAEPLAKQVRRARRRTQTGKS